MFFFKNHVENKAGRLVLDHFLNYYVASSEMFDWLLNTPLATFVVICQMFFFQLIMRKDLRSEKSCYHTPNIIQKVT